MDLIETAEAILSRRISATEAVRHSLDRIEKRDPQLRAFLSVNADQALVRATQIDEALSTGKSVGPLASQWTD